MEEMVQSTFEEGVLHRNGTVRLAGPISAVKVLATVQAVLASRIDRLAPAEKELLQTLAEKLNSAKLPQVHLYDHCQTLPRSPI